MKLIYIKSIVIILLLLFGCTTVAQNLKLEMAQSYRDLFEFEKAAEVYLDVIKKHPQNYVAYKGAAMCYTKLQQAKAAETILLHLDSMKLATGEDLLLLADAQKRNRKYKEALQTYKKHSTFFPGNELVNKYIDNKDWAHKINRDSSLFQLKNTSINTEFSDFAPCFYDNSLIYSSSKLEPNEHSKEYSWNNQAYLNLYKAELTLDSSLVKPTRLDKAINSRYHEGTVTYDKTNKVLFITRNNYNRGLKNKDEEGYLNLAIYTTQEVDGEFEKLTPFPYNSEEYSLGHPSISKDGLKLYFSSDMPGGKGGADIYVSERIDGKWAKPKNMGDLINTSREELFPYVHTSGVLYFSSNGHLGLGGLDIHSLDLNNESSQVQNAGYPLNSSYDDFSIIMDKPGKSGFYSSNRPGGLGDDDIYKFFISTPKFITVSGKILDEETGEPMKDASIFLKSANNPSKSDVVATSDGDGAYTFSAPFQEVYDLTASKTGYFEIEKKVNSRRSTSFVDNIDFRLSKHDFTAKGYVLEAEDGTPIKGARVVLLTKDGSVVSEISTSDDGSYSFGLHANEERRVSCELEGYALQSVFYDTGNLNSKVLEYDFNMFKLEVGVVVQLDNIYYDYGKAEIRPDAALELEKLISILLENPSMKIELSSHTDSRGTAPYNLILSKRRAKCAVDYILSKSIASDRIKSKGSGESKPLNKCSDGVKCSEEEYQINRRTEFTILDI